MTAERISSGSAPQNPMPAAGGQRTTRAATDALDEYALELAISAASDRMCAAEDRALKLQYWREMCRLIDQRTPARRRFMARLRGLQ